MHGNRFPVNGPKKKIMRVWWLQNDEWYKAGSNSASFGRAKMSRLQWFFLGRSTWWRRPSPGNDRSQVQCNLAAAQPASTKKYWQKCQSKISHHSFLCSKPKPVHRPHRPWLGFTMVQLFNQFATSTLPPQSYIIFSWLRGTCRSNSTVFCGPGHSDRFYLALGSHFKDFPRLGRP